MPDTPNRISSWPKSLRFTLYLLVLLLVQEGVFRYVFPLPEIANLDRAYYSVLGRKANTPRPSRNQPYYWESRPDTPAVFIHTMNRYGFRDKEWNQQKQPGKKRVVFIGDSFVEGVMASQDETIPEGFRQAGGAHFEVFNAGMLGVGLDAYLQFLADAVPIYKPEVVFFCIYANDLGKRQPSVPQFYLKPEYHKFWLPRIIELVRQAGKGTPIPARFGNSPKPFLPAVPERNNPWTTREDKLRAHVRPERIAQMKAGTYNPFRVNSLALEERNLKKPPALGETLPYIKYICEENGTKLLVVYLPSRNQVTRYYHPFEQESCLQLCPDTMDLTKDRYQLHQTMLANQCEEQGIPFLDLSPVVRRWEAGGEHLYWNFDEHMRGKGYLRLGKAIFEYGDSVLSSMKGAGYGNP